MRLDEAIAVVSGGAGGIGAATVAALQAAGARVAALDLRTGDVGDLQVACNLADDRAVDEAVARVTAVLGAPTILVHAAAISEFASTLDATPESFARVHDVNVGGALRLVRAIAPSMQAARRGSILFVSSINGARATPGLAAYAASKGALDTMMQTLALELAPSGVRVNAVAPASIDTPLLRESFARARDPEAARRANIARHPLGRLGTTQDVARLIAFLVSDDAAWITGAIVPVDGGAGLTRR